MHLFWLVQSDDIRIHMYVRILYYLDGPNECKLCCRNTDSQTCQVYTNENETGGFNLNNGALCTSGFCTNVR